MRGGDIIIIEHAVTQIGFKKCAPFNNYITKIDGTTVDDAKSLDFSHVDV